MQTPAVAVCLLALLAGAEAFAPMPVSTGARLGLRAVASRRPARGLALKMVDVPRVEEGLSIREHIKSAVLQSL